jgi:hypothetical protein
LKPETLRLIPNPVLGQTFPVPHEGSDESEGVVLYEADIPRIGGHHWIGVKVDNTSGEGWVVAGLDSKQMIVSDTSTFCQYFWLLFSIAEYADLALQRCFRGPYRYLFLPDWPFHLRFRICHQMRFWFIV